MTPRRFRTLSFALPFALLATVASSAVAQQRALDHDDVLHWNGITGSSLSPDGTWLVYVLTAMEGDPVLRVRAARAGAEELTLRGTRPAFTSDSRFLVYSIPPVEAVVDSLKREEKKGDDLPEDSLGVVALDGWEARTVAAVENFKVARDGTWVAYVPVEDEEEPYVDEGAALWQAFHYRNKQGGFYRGRTDRAATPELVIMANKTFRFSGKADDSDRWLITRQDFREFPDLWVTDGDITDMIELTDANPQQADYRWGSAEVVDWTSNYGVPLQGILHAPDGFDPAQKYPMMVCFYERMSDGIHSYRSPTPGGSSISVPFYASRGYVVFIPDIPYEVGYPGESALDAVVPGVLNIVARGFVKEDRIGVQGHSWGGYQIAYMITKTNLFAAAEAGAPVSNMTSAYGGIRWSSGMSRMFQYERTQSRIGGTLWESTSEYLHNSPVFYADKIHTPLLMLPIWMEEGVPAVLKGKELGLGVRAKKIP